MSVVCLVKFIHHHLDYFIISVFCLVNCHNSIVLPWLLEDIVMLITLGCILKSVPKHLEGLCVLIVDDTTNQGSGDTRAPNLTILRPDHDEDGDNEIPSPSSYFNLDQHENEEDATNVEHEGDVNEEEGNAEQALMDTLSASQVRCVRGPNKLPSGCFVITVVNVVGDHTQSFVLVNAWKTSVGKLIKENVPIMYRFWKGKTHVEKYIVPDSIKQNL
jgi:hypothetical protein